ncbi:MAG: hypothetical protein ACRCWS_08120 [Propionibacteriaceae bacterium]
MTDISLRPLQLRDLAQLPGKLSALDPTEPWCRAAEKRWGSVGLIIGDPEAASSILLWAAEVLPTGYQGRHDPRAMVLLELFSTGKRSLSREAYLTESALEQAQRRGGRCVEALVPFALTVPLDPAMLALAGFLPTRAQRSGVVWKNRGAVIGAWKRPDFSELRRHVGLGAFRKGN